MAEVKNNIVYLDNNKKQSQFIEAVFSGNYDILLFGGAIRGGKTYVAINILILLCAIYPGSRWIFVRKTLKRLRQNTKPAVMKFIAGTGWTINNSSEIYTHPNGSQIMLWGENIDRDPELDAFKGAEANGFVLEECNELAQKTLRKAQERAGSWIIPNIPLEKQPKPIILMTCNPTQGWVKDLIYDPWARGELPSNMFYLPSYVTDNPNLPEAYKESLKALPYYEYQVFVLGRWDVTIKTPNAFWHSLDVGTHLTTEEARATTTIHVSIDSNSMPYCSASIWQVYPEEKTVRQVGEVTARPKGEGQDNDLNHAGGLAKLVIDWLDDIEYNNTVFIYGDATTQSMNTIDPKKRSFFDIFKEELNQRYSTTQRIARSNPPIAITAQFVNALYSGWNGWSIQINERCKESLSDYLSVTTAEDGTMQKKRIKDDNGNSFEQYGHISDTKRYFIYKCLESTYSEWKNRFSEPAKYEPIFTSQSEVWANMGEI